MRLIGSKPGGGFELSTFNNDNIPPYAILSHTWSEGEEVTYDELVTGMGKNKAGYAKLRFCGERAAKDGLNYFWVDTCCIDKRDNNELSTALNSMFRWYQCATKCYVYLSDVHVLDEVPDAQAFRITWGNAFRRSRWFTRGWTLQELLAPASVEFFSANGKQLGSKITLEQEIHEITQIPIEALRNYDLREFKVDERMSWVTGRKTTVEEDKAYCLLGIFGVFLPLIYGEGEEHALKRLEVEIQRQSGTLQSSYVADTQRIPGMFFLLSWFLCWLEFSSQCAASKLLPFSRNEFFVGRENHLRTLEEQLRPSSVHRRMSIYGLGGGGKTALVLELAYRMMKKHSGLLVLWVPAISRETFDIAYREIGILLGIPGITDDNADVKHLVRNSLNSGSSDWLMVVDNADDPNILLEGMSDGPQSGRLYDFLPRSDRGSILFTTRGRKAAERLTQGNVLELEDMSRVEAKQLMARRISNKALLDDESATNKLLELLTCLPLAIVQAVAFINSNQVSISDYVSLFKQADTEVEVFSERFDDPSRYRVTESTIEKTWQISFDQIMKQDQLAAGYLSFMACVDRVNIPQSLLPNDGSTVQKVKALGTLTGYAFISERQHDSQLPEGESLFDVHRLVQKATVWWLMEHSDWTAWTEKAHCRLEELVPYGGHEGRQKWINYLPHAMHVSSLHSGLSEVGRASLLDRIGRCQVTLGQYTAAEATHRQVLSLRRKALGDEDASTLTSMNEVGLALCNQGKYEEGETMHRQTLALMEKVIGKEHPSTLMSMNNLAFVLNNQGKYKEAETMHRRTLALKEEVLGKEHPSTLTSLSNLAFVLDKQGKYEKAETMHRQTLALMEKVLGKEHPDTLTTMNNLAFVLNKQGKYEEAETMHRQTLALMEKVLGKEHPVTLLSVYCLAYSLAKRDSFVEATTLYQRACEGYSMVFRDDHPTARACRQHYVEMLQRKEQSELISTSGASCTVLSNKKSASEDGSGVARCIERQDYLLNSQPLVSHVGRR